MSKTSQIDRQGVNLVEGLVLDDWIFREQEVEDLGVDAHVELRDINKRGTGRLIALQIKSGKSYLGERSNENFVFRVDKQHIEYWLGHSLPVIVLLADTDSNVAYWQSVNRETAKNTGKQWKVLVPTTQTISPESESKLSAIARACPDEDFLVDSDYEVIKEEEPSHALAKRYSANVLAQGTLNKNKIRQILREVTGHLRGQQYYRSEQTRLHFKQRRADVVWVYVTRTLRDAKECNWICRSQWISPDLNPEYSPGRCNGDEEIDGIEIVWNPHYGERTKLLSQQSVSKADFFGELDVFVHEINELEQLLSGYDADSLVEFVLEKSGKLQALDLKAMGISNGPTECVDLRQVFLTLMSNIGNMGLVAKEYLSGTREMGNMTFLVSGYARDFMERAKNFRYEYKKSRN